MAEFIPLTPVSASSARVQTPTTPAEFVIFNEQGLRRGFKHVESGPLVRSSYHAHEHVPQS